MTMYIIDLCILSILSILSSSFFRITSHITPFQFQKVQPQQSMWSNAQLRRAAHVQAIPQTEILITRPDPPDRILSLWSFQPYLLELQGWKTILTNDASFYSLWYIAHLLEWAKIDNWVIFMFFVGKYTSSWGKHAFFIYQIHLRIIPAKYNYIYDLVWNISVCTSLLKYVLNVSYLHVS